MPRTTALATGNAFWPRRRFLRVAAGTFAVLAAPQSLRGAERPISRIAFGACAEQDKPQPVWQSILESRPEVFLFLGDNIYGDTLEPAVLRRKYQELGAKPGFQRLRETVPILATWDDHDFGQDDGGADYALKHESKQIFLDFFGEPPGTERRERDDGIHSARIFGPPGQRLQVILLDTRFARTPLLRVDSPLRLARRVRSMGPYLSNPDPAARMLSEAQWVWLADQLEKPAELRLLCSSTPVLMDFTGWETWANMPLQRERLVHLIKATGATGVVILSGDIHGAELSRRIDRVPYPLWELTSSGLTKAWPFAAPNVNRIGNPYRSQNYGVVEIDWETADPTVTLRAHATARRPVITQSLSLSTLRAE